MHAYMQEVTKFKQRWTALYTEANMFQELVKSDDAFSWARPSAILQDRLLQHVILVTLMPASLQSQASCMHAPNRSSAACSVSSQLNVKKGHLPFFLWSGLECTKL